MGRLHNHMITTNINIKPTADEIVRMERLMRILEQVNKLDEERQDRLLAYVNELLEENTNDTTKEQ